MEPNNSTECFEAELPEDEKNDQCCYIKNATVATCHVFPKMDVKEIPKKYKEYEGYQIDCQYTPPPPKSSASYLETGFLLLISMLLL